MSRHFLQELSPDVWSEAVLKNGGAMQTVGRLYALAIMKRKTESIYFFIQVKLIKPPRQHLDYVKFFDCKA